jgi:biotin carboxyl carrier protein
LVLEAMKMQNEIRAPKAGTIRAVAVIAGKTVNSGDFLLSLE